MTDFSFSNYADQFDDHIEKSIRGYTDLRDDIVSMSKYFIEDRTSVIDIGCSQGTMLKRIKDANSQAPNTFYVGLDVEPSFKKHWNTEEEKLDYILCDVRDYQGFLVDKRDTSISLVISLFTMQFIPERDRLSILKKIYDNLTDGGAFIFSEKLYSSNSQNQNMMEFLYFDYKRTNFSEKEILDKEQELRHLAKNTNEELLIEQLKSVGFEGIQCFWRNFNFAGFVARRLPKTSITDTDDENTNEEIDSVNRNNLNKFTEDQRIIIRMIYQCTDDVTFSDIEDELNMERHELQGTMGSLTYRWRQSFDVSKHHDRMWYKRRNKYLPIEPLRTLLENI